MKPTLLVLGLGSILGAFYSLREHPVEGRWSTEGGRGHDIVLVTKDGRLGGSGTWAIDGDKRCRVSLDMSFVSDDKRRYFGTLQGEDECRGMKAPLDCSLDMHETLLDCGQGLSFRRVH
jgi:hypothetical protein